MNRTCRRIIAAFILLACFCGSANPARADEIKVKTSGGIEKINAVREGSLLYYDLSELNSLLGGTVKWEQLGYSVKFTLDTNSFVFTVGSPYVRFNGSVRSMLFPARIIKGALFVPAKTFSPLLDLAHPDNVIWDAADNTLRIDEEWFNLTDLAISPKQNGLLIEIFMPSPLKYQIYQSEGNWLNIEFPDGKVNRNKIMSSVNRACIKNVNVFQFETSAQISLQLKFGFQKHYEIFQSDPGRLQISVENETFVADSVETSLIRIGPDEKVDIVVIDAGHGGDDFGAIGRSKKTREKDITLEIANELARLVRRDKKLKVVMTRTSDEFVPLDKRAQLANDARADLFISIHCNAAPQSSAHGFEIFYLAPAKSDSARAVAQFENAPFLLADPTLSKDTVGDLAVILNDMIQREFSTESADLAYMTDMEMRKNLDIKSRGVDHAGFIVLNRVYMPSVLVESAFISNKNEEKLLRGDDFQKKLAQSLYNAILRFKAKYERI